MRRSHALVPLACLLAVLAASCHRETTPEAPPAAPPGDASEGAAELPAASSLAPLFTIAGGGSRMPDSVTVQFARALEFAHDDEGGLSEDTALVLEPAMRGQLSIDGASTLTFTPASAFEPATTYRVRLASVATRGGVVRPEPADAWTTTFTTPPFRFETAILSDLQPKEGLAVVEISFTGPVDAKQALGRMTFTAGEGERLRARLAWDGRPREDAEPAPPPHVVVVELGGASLAPGGTLGLEIDRGVRMLGSRVSADEASARLPLVEFPRLPEVRVLSAHAAEGTNGYFIEIVGSDGAVTERRWYWDPVSQQGFGEISARCAFDERDLAEKLRFEPPVPFTLAPSGAGVRVFGDFRRGSVTLRMDAGVRTADGGITRRSFERTISIPARSARVSFASKGRYLPREQWRALPFRHLNVDQVDVAIRHVRPENLVFWASAEDESATPRESDLLARTRLPVKAEPDALATSWLDVAALAPSATRGLLEITLTSGNVSDSSRLLLTDIQLVAKRETGVRGSNQGGDVRAWTFDASTLRPLGGVQVDLVRPSGQVVATATTDSSGEARLRVRTPQLPQEAPFALVARKGEDVTYLAFDEVRAEVDDEHVGGEAPDSSVAWRAALFTDRGVYRPGETAHASAIVRDAAYGPVQAGMPAILRLVDPRGRVVSETPLELSAAGFATHDLDFADFATTGRHELQLDIAGKRVASHRFHVEEFAPERMRVEARPRAQAVLAGDPVVVDVEARYLFGGVPADHQVELSCTVEPFDFAPAENAQFHYGSWRDAEAPSRAVALGTSSGVLDEEGRVELACATAQGASLQGPGRAIVSAAVFEAGGGRSTIGQAAVTVHPSRHAIGLSSRTALAKAGEPLLVEGVVVDWDGKLAESVTEVELTLLRLEREYGWWWDEDAGHSTHRSYTRSVTEGSLKARVNGGRFSAELRPSSSAMGFLVRATAGTARSELRVEGSDDYGWWDEWGEGRSADRTPRAGKPEWIAMKVPASARVGKRTEIGLTAPHRGRLLMTVEADGLLHREWKDVDAGPVSWSFELEEFHPNVYVTALLVKPPHLESEQAFVPDRAYGVASIPVEPTAHVLPVQLGVPDEVRSGAPLTVSIDLGKLEAPAQVVVAAVDEGILSLTKFASPDPLPQVFTRRALGVETYETIGWTLMSSPPPPSGEGSGDEALAAGRVQAIKPVALWSGLVDVPVSGKAQVTFDVPTYRGQLRVMAVAATPKRMGSASRQVIVRDPLTLQVTMPRFLVQDDVAQVPVFVTNLSGRERQVEVSLLAEALDVGGEAGSLDVSRLVAVSGGKQVLDLADGASGTALFTLGARGKSGAVRLLASATSGDLRSKDEADVPLLPTGPRTRQVTRVPLAQGDTSLSAALEGWEPLSERTTIRVTGNPHADAFEHLKHLIRYPYGCIEQTVSSSRPLLAMQQLALEVDPKLLASGGIEDRLRSGIERVLSMQRSTGAFSYWPGGGDDAWWGTAYATHFLLDARKAGHAVPEDRVDAALAWMEGRITSHYEQGRQHGDWYSENAEPYFHLVLARAGKGRPARAEALLQAVPGESEGHRKENEYMLQAALWLSGDRRFEPQLRAADISPLTEERRNSWSFYSDRRRRGFMLSTRVDLFGADPGGEKLANLVAEGLRARPSTWYTTQELVWSLTGLSKFLGAQATFSVPLLTAGSRKLEPEAPPPGSASPSRTWDVPRASEQGEIVVSVAEKGEGSLWAIVSSEGVRQGAVARAESAGLHVSRSFVDAAGVPADALNEPLRLGDLAHVVVTISNRTSERVANIALVDRIPAGWEIENPRLGRKAALDWLPEDELWAVDHLDIRDDRLEAFGHLEAGETRKLAYSVRAVTTGRFTLPSVEAEAMYDPTVRARALGGRVEVLGPWAPVAQ